MNHTRFHHEMMSIRLMNHTRTVSVYVMCMYTYTLCCCVVTRCVTCMCMDTYTLSYYAQYSMIVLLATYLLVDVMHQVAV